MWQLLKKTEACFQCFMTLLLRWVYWNMHCILDPSLWWFQCKLESGSPMNHQTPDAAILVTVVAGEALEIVKDTSDEELVSQCMDTLRRMFPEQVSALDSYILVASHCVLYPGCSYSNSYQSFSVVKGAIPEDVIFLCRTRGNRRPLPRNGTRYCQKALFCWRG